MVAGLGHGVGRYWSIVRRKEPGIMLQLPNSFWIKTGRERASRLWRSAHPGS
jgi:hypothetical protein